MNMQSFSALIFKKKEMKVMEIEVEGKHQKKLKLAEIRW